MRDNRLADEAVYFGAVQDGVNSQQDEIERLRAENATLREAIKGNAKDEFYELGGDEETDPVERLRFFCSLSMRGQDWLDVEPFFSAIKDAGKQ